MLSAVSPDSCDGLIIYRELRGGLKAARSPPWDDCFPLVNGQRCSQSPSLHHENKADGKTNKDFAVPGITMGLVDIGRKEKTGFLSLTFSAGDGG